MSVSRQRWFSDSAFTDNSAPASAHQRLTGLMPLSPLFRAFFLCVLATSLAACPAVAMAKKPKLQGHGHAPKPPLSDNVPDVVTYGRRDDVVRFGVELAERRHLDPAWVKAALERARFVPNVAKFIMPAPAGTAKNWAAYRTRFVEPVRIRAGLAFWRANEKWLEKAEAVFGVPPEIVIGIIGVETIYGRQMGGFRIIDALATLAFDFPPGRKDRSPFFRDELESYLLMCHIQGIDPLELKGSYAGALGMPQFMPSSVNKYAIDFDGDGHVDLHANPADVIGSVAHYLAEFGWERGLPTRFGVVPPVDPADRAVLLGPDILPSFTATQFTERGAKLDAAALAMTASAADRQVVQSDEVSEGTSAASAGEQSAAPQSVAMMLALVELHNGDAAPSYVAGTRNFYAITRYNWSSYYAMAVIDLGEAVARELARKSR